MDENDNNFESFSKSISCRSQHSEYSDACENYDQVIRFSNVNTTDKQDKPKNNFTKNKENLIKENINNNNKRINPIPEDTNENLEGQNNYLRKLSYINNINTNINESQKFDEDLYSIKDECINDSSIEKNSEIGIFSKHIDNSDFIKKDNVNFKTKFEPVNTIFEEHSNFIDNLNINSINKIRNGSAKTAFKKNKTFNNIQLKKQFTDNNILKKNTDTNISAKNPKKTKKFKYYDLKNILKKAVILNSKKEKQIKKSFQKDNKNSLLSDNFNKNNVINEDFPINHIIFNNIKIDELNTNYLQKYLRRIDLESKNKYLSHRYKKLIELQNFFIDGGCSPVWVVKLSHDGNFLAAGCGNGKIKIYEIIGYRYLNFKAYYNKNNILKYLNFINEVPYKTLERHKSDIIDLSWSPFNHNLLLSASLDHFVFLWDISQEGNNLLINRYEHSDIVTCVSFNPINRNIFISGCLDTFVRIWKCNYDRINNNLNDDLNSEINSNKDDFNENSDVNIISSLKKTTNNKNTKNKMSFFSEKNEANVTYDDMNKTKDELEEPQNKDSIYYFNIAHKITAISYFPDGSKIGVGTEKGRIYVYNTSPKINYNNNFFVCRKKFGFFGGGKKVTSIQFIDKSNAIVSTCDSYIRLVDMVAGRIIYKYKGYVNKYSMTRANIDFCDDVIIAGGEDGFCYIWNLFDKVQINKKENKNFIKFKPFSKELIASSIIAHEKCYVNYMQKILKLTNKILINSIIIIGTNKGKMEILLNIDE